MKPDNNIWKSNPRSPKKDEQ
ncbi:uncharacterized protein G2W53_007859 [Senna tora]|uniref:Uncharacterized protein n=1 Tax=Senna tora TaxID=362788 RepID=A0A834VY76_9FABA|nr:uncharacterized protein G2W53_044806 [Senna tora]KAF7839377.1 uncharacterized protein G2W53_007859 [Senna tora]